MPPQKTKPKKDHKPKREREPLPLDPDGAFDPAAKAAEVLAAGDDFDPAVRAKGKQAVLARILRIIAALLAGAAGGQLARHLAE